MRVKERDKERTDQRDQIRERRGHSKETKRETRSRMDREPTRTKRKRDKETERNLPKIIHPLKAVKRNIKTISVTTYRFER